MFFWNEGLYSCWFDISCTLYLSYDLWIYTLPINMSAFLDVPSDCDEIEIERMKVKLDGHFHRGRQGSTEERKSLNFV